MQWCEEVGTEPYLCLNFGTGTLDEGMRSTFDLVVYNLTGYSAWMARVL